MSFSGPTGGGFPDVAVVGTGVIGLACALELADRNLRVSFLGRPLGGEASMAAAGLLAPSVEPLDGGAGAFATLARDLYPEWLAGLEERWGARVALSRDGILELPGPHRAVRVSEGWLDSEALAELEPALAGHAGATLYPLDGWVDNVALMNALTGAAQRHPRIQWTPALAARLEVRGDDDPVVHDDAGTAHRATEVILAAGAWTPGIQGVGRRLPVEPVRGQMLAYPASPLGHAVYARGAYLVPRGDHLLVGSTMEKVGFDYSITDSAGDALHAAAANACPMLAGVETTRRWAGLRPVTPDMLPVIGRDPERPRVIFACGHSRNGILMARATALAVADLVTEAASRYDLRPFSPRRFINSG